MKPATSMIDVCVVCYTYDLRPNTEQKELIGKSEAALKALDPKFAEDWEAKEMRSTVFAEENYDPGCSPFFFKQFMGDIESHRCPYLPGDAQDAWREGAEKNWTT